MSSAKKNRVLLARSVARKWLEAKASPEYRMCIYGSQKVRKLPDLLRAFRDGKVRIGGINPVFDMGVVEKFDSVEVWSSDRDSLLSLRKWCEKIGLETSGIW